MNTIITNRLTLRPFKDEDWTRAVRILTDNQVNQTYMIPDFPNDEAARPLFQRLKQLSEDEKRFVRAICLEDELIGFMNDVEVVGQRVEMGYVIATAHKGNGYATEALTAAIAALFQRGFETVRCGAFEENPASCRVMAKSGMHLIEETEVIAYRGKDHRCIYYEINK